MGRLKGAASAVAGLLMALLSMAGARPAWGACEVPTEWLATRPDPEGPPTAVHIGAYLIDLLSIDDSAQSFQADIFLSVSWRDPRLVSDPLSVSLVGCRLDPYQAWNPSLVFVNERSVRRLLDEHVTVAADGTVEYLQRLQGEFSTPLDLRDFPFDDHELSLDIVARGHSPEQIELVPEKSGGLVAELTITDWDLGQSYSKVESRYVEPRDRYVPGVSFRVPVKRRLGFYLMKTFLPLALIVCMSWAVFWIQPGLLPPQIGVATSAVLTLIAFQFSLGYMLPRLSYLTRADRFLIGSTLLVFLAFGEALWTSYLANHDHEARAVRIDEISRVVFPLSFLVLLIFSFIT